MPRLTVLAISSVLALSTAPVHAQTAGDVMQGIGRAINGEPSPYRDYEWREHQRERAYRYEQRRLDAEQRTSTHAAGNCATSAASRRETGFTAPHAE
jgi:hypothetical protein